MSTLPVLWVTATNINTNRFLMFVASCSIFWDVYRSTMSLNDPKKTPNSVEASCPQRSGLVNTLVLFRYAGVSRLMTDCNTFIFPLPLSGLIHLLASLLSVVVLYLSPDHVNPDCKCRALYQQQEENCVLYVARQIQNLLIQTHG